MKKLSYTKQIYQRKIKGNPTFNAKNLNDKLQKVKEGKYEFYTDTFTSPAGVVLTWEKRKELGIENMTYKQFCKLINHIYSFDGISIHNISHTNEDWGKIKKGLPKLIKKLNEK